MKQHTHVIITGGGRGLGLGMALRYLKRGCNLSILNRVMTPESTEQLDAAAQTGQAQWQFHAIEISEFEQVQAAVQKAVEQFGAPELAINSAGVLINKADRKSTRLNSSHVRISYAVFCLKKKN